MDLTRRELLLAAGAPLVLGAVRPALALGDRLAPSALVTADTTSHVVAVDLMGGARVRARIPTPPGPRSIERAGGRTAVVAHPYEGVVSLLDGHALRVARVVRGMGAPRYTAARRDGPLAYVTDSERGEVAAIDVARGRIVARLEVGGPARHVSLAPDGRRLWTALGSKAEEIALIDVGDPRRPRLLRHIRPPFLVHDVVVAPDGRRVRVSSGDRRRLVLYDAAELQPVYGLDADAPPQHIAFSRDAVLVTSGVDGTLRVHASDDGRLRHTHGIPTGSYNVTAGAAAHGQRAAAAGGGGERDARPRSDRCPRVAVAVPGAPEGRPAAAPGRRWTAPAAPGRRPGRAGFSGGSEGAEQASRPTAPASPLPPNTPSGPRKITCSPIM